MTQEFIQSWGRIGRWSHEVNYLHTGEEKLASFGKSLKGLPYGNGNSYGDVCLNPNGGLWKTTNLDRFISFNEDTGVICCEAGVLLGDIQALIIPRGWILPVTPGTQFVTVGGAIANDVHGKNHHVKGSFGNHIKKFELLRTDGTHVECSLDIEPGLFSATIGGLGLTGVILKVYIQLMPVRGAWLDSETISFSGVSEFLALANKSESDWEYTVSWIDCLSGKKANGIFFRANHSAENGKINIPEHRIIMPFTPPCSLVNKLTLRPFNLFYRKLQQLKEGKEQTHYQSFFYPLDNVIGWNRIYGQRGFYQYQCVVPKDLGVDAIENMLAEISKSGLGSFLAVLKTFGSLEPLGMLSFPQPGITLALDFPNQGDRTLRLFQRLNTIVLGVRGRIYAAKDAHMPKELFEAGYPRLSEFIQYRDPGIRSGLSSRLMGS